MQGVTLPICEKLRNDAVCQNRMHGPDPLCVEAAELITELVEALGVVASGDVDVSDTAIIVGNGAKTVMRQVRAVLIKAGVPTP